MRNPTRMRRAAATFGVIALAAAGATGTTWAAFSDFAVVPDNVIGAGTVVIGEGNPAGYNLTVDELKPGRRNKQTVTLDVNYLGTVAADIALDIDPSNSAWCKSSRPLRARGELQIRTDDTPWISYCDGLRGTQDFTLATALQPGGTVKVTLHLRLLRRDKDDNLLSYDKGDKDTDFWDREFTSTDPLTVTAVQSEGGKAFTDYATGSLTVSAATIAVPTPHECSPLGLSELPTDRVIVLTEKDDVLDLTNGEDADETGPAGTPTNEALGYLILGLGGDDTITGSNGRDCIVGGDGKDVLAGGNQKDVLLGGNGDDELRGENAKDVLDDGPGDDALDGGNGKDHPDGGKGADGVTPDATPQDDIADYEKPQSDGSVISRPGEPGAPVAPQAEEPASEERVEGHDKPAGEAPAGRPVGPGS